MRIAWRRPGPGEINFEAWFAGVGVAGAGLGAAWLSLGLPTPKCLFHTVTGIPCLTCGSTRATRALVHGDLAGALSWNPLMTAFLGLLALYVAYCLVVAVFNLPRLRIDRFTRPEANVLRIAAVLLLVVNWIYLVRSFPG